MVRSTRLHEWFELAVGVQREADEVGLGLPRSEPIHANGGERTILERFDEAVTNESLRSASRKLLADGHYARAVEEAFKCLNHSVKEKSGLSETDGDALMRTAFSANSPKLYLNDLKTRSEQDEQRGYMDLYAGAMTGIRNPRAHEHQLVDQPETAVELLVLANHLMRKLQIARRSDTKT